MARLREVGSDFFDTAPQRFSRTWEIAAPASLVWGELTGESPLHWCRGLSVRWSSKRPFGVGSTRTARVLGAVVVAEQFFLWEEEHRYAFFAPSMNLALFDALAEDYVIEPRGPDACTYTWTIALAPSALGRPGAALNPLIFASAFRDTGKYFRAK